MYTLQQLDFDGEMVNLIQGEMVSGVPAVIEDFCQQDWEAFGRICQEFA